MGKYWSLGKGRYGYVTSRGKRGIASSRDQARKKAGLTRKKPSSKTAKKGVSKMARRKVSIPLSIVAPILGNFAKRTPRGPSIIESAMRGDLPGAIHDIREVFGGIDDRGNLKVDWLLNTYGPIIAGTLIHKFVGGEPLNLNKTLAAAGVPLIRI